MESAEKVAVFTHVVQESIKRTKEFGCTEKLFDLWSDSINHSEKMKELQVNVKNMFTDYQAENMKLGNPLSEIQITYDLRYMLAKREDNLSKTGFIIREGLHHALSSLLKVHPELGIKNILDELESLESNKADGEKSKKDNKSNDTLKTSASQSDNECLKVEAGSDTLCNPSDLSRYSFGQGLLNFDPSSSKTPESPHQGRAHSSKRSRKDLPKRTSYDKFYSEKYGYSSCSKYENRHGDLKDYLYQRSRSSRSNLKESRRSKRRKSYSRSRSRSRSPSKRKSFKKERSRKKSDKEKKREKFLRHFSSEYHSEYDDLYKSYQHKVDTISCKEREDFDAAKNCKPLPTLNSTHEVNFTGLSETAIQELKDSQKILQMIDKKLA